LSIFWLASQPTFYLQKPLYANKRSWLEFPLSAGLILYAVCDEHSVLAKGRHCRMHKETLSANGVS
jgi:hypothetical protein